MRKRSILFARLFSVIETEWFTPGLFGASNTRLRYLSITRGITIETG